MLFSLLLVLATTPATPPPTLEVEPAYRTFLEQLERGINAGEGKAIDDHVDIDRLFERISQGIPAPKNLSEAFKKGVRTKGVKLGEELVSVRGDGEGLHLLNARTEAGVTRALFRSVTGSGLNYFDFELARNPKGEVIIVDLYVFISGEAFSETLRRMYLATMVEAQQGLLDKLMGKEQEFLKNLPKMQQMQKLVQEQKNQEALDVFGTMAPSMRKQKPVLLMRMRAALQVGDAEYAKAISDLEKAFPDDSALDLVSIDGHMMRKDYPAVMRTIDRLDQRVKDPYLKFLRGSVMLDKGDMEAAKKYLEETIRAEVTLQTAWFALIGLSLQEKQYKETARLLTGIERDAGVELADLREISEYEGFVKSPEGKAWLKKH